MAAQSQEGSGDLLIAESAGGGFRDHRVVAQYGLATQYGQPAHTEHPNVDTEFVGATNFAGHIKDAQTESLAPICYMPAHASLFFTCSLTTCPA